MEHTSLKAISSKMTNNLCEKDEFFCLNDFDYILIDDIS